MTQQTYKSYKDLLRDKPKINLLKVTGNFTKNKHGNIQIECICECGTLTYKYFSDLNYSNLKRMAYSCGCYLKNRCSELGKSNRKYSINSSKIIDSPAVRYIIGLYAADGHVNRSGSTLTLQERDGLILEKIKNYLEYSGSTRFINRKKENYQNSISLFISDKNFLNLLENHGLGYKKTENLTVPEYLKEDKDFWRGMIDGDGCIFKYDYGFYNYGVQLVGTLPVIEAFKEFVEKLGIRAGKIYKIKDTFVYNLKVSNKNSVPLLDILYKDLEESDLYIKRKYEKYREIKDINKK